MPSPSPKPTLAVLAADTAFLRRVHISSLLFTVLGGMLASYAKGFAFGGAFVVAALWSTANFWALEQLMRLVISPQRDGLKLVLALAVKIPVLYGSLLLILFKGGFTAIPLFIGFSLPLWILVMKAAGRALVPKIALKPADSGAGQTVISEGADLKR